jgi:hypothetical protein
VSSAGLEVESDGGMAGVIKGELMGYCLLRARAWAVVAREIVRMG